MFVNFFGIKVKKIISSSKSSQVQIKPLEPNVDNLLNYQTIFIKMFLDTTIQIDVIYIHLKAFKIFKRFGR